MEDSASRHWHQIRKDARSMIEVVLEKERSSAERSAPQGDDVAPLTAALLKAAAATSFATPGHRTGRSSRWTR
jgi:hypothetical protein